VNAGHACAICASGLIARLHWVGVAPASPKPSGPPCWLHAAAHPPSPVALPPSLFPLRSASYGGQVEQRRTGRAMGDRRGLRRRPRYSGVAPASPQAEWPVVLVGPWVRSPHCTAHFRREPTLPPEDRMQPPRPPTKSVIQIIDLTFRTAPVHCRLFQ
jgi:hypothetical protein